MFFWSRCSLFFSIMSLSSNAQAAELFVSAAASLKDALTAIEKEFTKTSLGNKIVFNFASSGQLKAQIENHAPIDVFISAAMADIESLEKKGLILAGSKAEFAKNRLAVVRRPQISIASLNDLAKKEVLRIAMGNPSTVPAGTYAKETLASAKLYEALQPKLIFAENVRQVLDYVERGEVDAGFVYTTDAILAKTATQAFVVDDSLHQPIIYGMAIVKDTKQTELAKAFLLFVTEKKKTLLAQYGFR